MPISSGVSEEALRIQALKIAILELIDLKSPVFSQRPKCAGVANHENGLFFPEQHRYQKDPQGNPMTPQQMAEDAKDFCHGRSHGPECPVRSECLEWAMENWQRYGVYGGMSEPERSKLKELRAQAGSSASVQREIFHERCVERTKRGRETRSRRAHAYYAGRYISPEEWPDHQQCSQKVCTVPPAEQQTADADGAPLMDRAG